MAQGLPSASVVENVQFNQFVIIPNAVQGLFRKRPGPVAVATRVGVDGQAVRLIRGLRRKYGDGPVWVRVVRDKALLVLSVDDVRRVLEGSPHPFASDPEAKRKGMGHFQPDALTLSRGELWENRRRFAEAVLDSPAPVHRHGEDFLNVVTQETAILLGEVDTDDAGMLGYDALHRSFRRMVRRIVLGDAARDDSELSELLGELMSEANKLPSERSEHYEPYMEKLRGYVERAEPGSLVGLIAAAPSDPDTRVEGQITHWLFALQDTLAANVLRALALIAAHPEQRKKVDAELAVAADVTQLKHLRACLQDAMRLYPTTPMLSRETLVDVTWGGEPVPAGTQVLIVNTFHHRDPDRLAYADRFAPEEWTEGDAAQEWAFNQFSHGPQGCPGSNLALMVGTAVLEELLRAREPKLLEPDIDPEQPLSNMLDFFRIKIALD